MLEWILRGLRKGSVTTRYPRSAPDPMPGFRGRVVVARAEGAPAEIADVCPTGAIAVADGAVSLDRGRCILCGACVAADPTRFRFDERQETAARRRSALVAGAPPEGVDELRAALGERSRTLRRSIHVRHVDAGSDGGEEWEVQALTNPYYDVQRLGVAFTPSPRHADVLLVTGGVTPSMADPLRRAYEAMPEPKAVVAAGTGDGAGGVDTVLAVDVYVPGSPPSPIALLHGLLLAAGILTGEAAA